MPDILRIVIFALAVSFSPTGNSFAAGSVFASETILKSTDGAIEAQVLPIGSEKYLVQVTGTASDLNSRPFVFRGESSSRRQTLESIGHVADYVIFSTGQTTLVKGTSVPTWELKFYKNVPSQVLVVVKGENGQEKQPDLKELTGKYARSEAASSPLENEKDGQAALATLNKEMQASCASKASAQVAWREFKGPSSWLALSRALQGLKAMTHLCQTDGDYKSAIAQLKTVHFKYSGKQADFHGLEKKGSEISIMVTEGSENNYLQFIKWLRDHL